MVRDGFLGFFHQIFIFIFLLNFYLIYRGVLKKKIIELIFYFSGGSR